ncbi:hypothetical protein BH11PLA1_BH11PLA1_22560 [soil metagenome]
MSASPDSFHLPTYAALCSDYVVNLRLNVKMDLPVARETLLSMLDRLRKDFPALARLRRQKAGLSLESDPDPAAEVDQEQWVELRRTSIRSGVTNPRSAKAAYALHRLVLDTAPFYLSISPLDVDYIELSFGFDLPCAAQHDAIVFDTLVGDSPMGRLLMPSGKKANPFDAGIPIDCQPMLGIALNPGADLQAHYEIKTSPVAKAHPHDDDREPEPITVYLILRKYGPAKDIADLRAWLDIMIRRGEDLIDQRLVPHLLMPLHDATSAAGSGGAGGYEPGKD